MLKRGLILMVGAAGAGKSTTLAAMINHRNENSSDHILTIEDPIEFLHTNKSSIVNQREVGLDTKSYARALRGVVRAAPDVILIGEIRDRESMEAAIDLAGTGHLCIATMHANNCAETLDRIINMFPREQHNADLPGPVAVPARHPVAAPGHGEDGRRASPRRSHGEHAAHLGAHQEGRRGRRQGSDHAPARERGMQSFDCFAVQAGAGRPHRARGGARAAPTRAPISKRRSTSAERPPRR